ncbi:MAG: S1 RNA-binding domain-containing protein [Lachnospiraceae bacterium]|nr:S1 RNA-binding domain-containing protein [Lachnospiraceae bacterium]
MAETMDDYKKELEQSFEKLANGDVMSGKVENEDEAVNAAAWQHMKELKDSGEDFDVKVGGMVNGGLIAYVEEIRAFIPASQISMDFVENLDEYLGKTLKVRVITADPNRKKLVLSSKVILKEKAEKELEEKRNRIHAGDIVKGKVESLMPYGAFIDLGDGVSGLVHISRICNERIKHPGVKLKEGEEVTAKVIEIKDGKISLSIRALLEDDEEASEERIEIPKSEELTTNMGALLKGIKL